MNSLGQRQIRDGAVEATEKGAARGLEPCPTIGNGFPSSIGAGGSSRMPSIVSTFPGRSGSQNPDSTSVTDDEESMVSEATPDRRGVRDGEPVGNSNAGNGTFNTNIPAIIITQDYNTLGRELFREDFQDVNRSGSGMETIAESSAGGESRDSPEFDPPSDESPVDRCSHRSGSPSHIGPDLSNIGMTSS